MECEKMNKVNYRPAIHTVYVNSQNKHICDYKLK